jgi:hypothetical protein
LRSGISGGGSNGVVGRIGSRVVGGLLGGLIGGLVGGLSSGILGGVLRGRSSGVRYQNRESLVLTMYNYKFVCIYAKTKEQRKRNHDSREECVRDKETNNK